QVLDEPGGDHLLDGLDELRYLRDRVFRLPRMVEERRLVDRAIRGYPLPPRPAVELLVRKRRDVDGGSLRRDGLVVDEDRKRLSGHCDPSILARVAVAVGREAKLARDLVCEL